MMDRRAFLAGGAVVVERRYAAFKYDELPELAANLVGLKPDVIVTSGNPSSAVPASRGRAGTLRARA